MCGGFQWSRNTLILLNAVYILVSFLIIGVAVHGKVSGIVTSLPIVGGITASGVFLLFISVVGLIGAMKHHQVMLFFYMLVLFFIFIIQFSCSCAALSVGTHEQQYIIYKAWSSSENKVPSLVIEAERTFDCCGVGLNKTADGGFDTYKHPNKEDMKWSDEHKVFDNTDLVCKDHNSTSCFTCYTKIQPKVDSGFSAAGGLGLFFSFPEIIGVIATHKYRVIIRDMGEFA